MPGPTTPPTSRKDGVREPGLRKHSCGKTALVQVRHEAQLPDEGHRNLSRDKSPCSIVPRIPNLKIPLDPSINTCFAIPNVDACEPGWVKAAQGPGRETSRVSVSNGDAPPWRAVTPRCPELRQGVLKISAITFPFQKLFNHTLLSFLVPDFLLKLRIWECFLNKGKSYYIKILKKLYSIIFLFIPQYMYVFEN